MLLDFQGWAGIRGGRGSLPLCSGTFARSYSVSMCGSALPENRRRTPHQKAISQNTPKMATNFANPPSSYDSLSGPSGPKWPRSVPESVSENGGCLKECPTGCFRGLWAPPECSGHLLDTLGALLDTPEHGARRAPETPRRTLTPRFRGHSQKHSGDTSGPKGPERLL